MANIKLVLMSTVLEIAVDTFEDAVAAVEAGADRLELVSDLAMQGLTPPEELVRAVCRAVGGAAGVPVVAMVRPRPGDFEYSYAEMDMAVRQVERVTAAGAAGVVFGSLTPAGDLDEESLQRIIQVLSEARTTGGAEVRRDGPHGHNITSSVPPYLVVHRAIDFTRDPIQSLRVCARLGVKRVLTAGCCTWATAGEGAGLANRIALWRSYVMLQLPGLEVMPGGGVRPGNVTQIIDGVFGGLDVLPQVHSACRGIGGSGIPCGTHRMNVGLVRAMREILGPRE
jgi:copper homeostasis protein